MKDYYSILGVNEKSSQDEIKKAFRKLAMETHPDKHPGDKKAEEKFKEINEAYSVLGDEKKKTEYDNQRTFGVGGPGAGPNFGNSAWFKYQNFRPDGADPFGFGESVFDEFFRDSFGFRRGANPFAEHDPDENISKKFRVSINFKEAYCGCKKDISFDREIVCPECEGTGADKKSKLEKCTDCNGSGSVKTPFGTKKCSKCLGKGIRHTGTCSKCHGSGTLKTSQTLSVNIPAGAFDGMELRIRGMGNESKITKSRGDVFLVISTPKFSDDGTFKRLEGADMEMNLQLSLYEMMSDKKVKITLPDGNPFTVKIPKDSQPGAKLKVLNKGFKLLAVSNGKTRGDLYINLALKMPKNLTPEQLDLLKKFDESLEKS